MYYPLTICRFTKKNCTKWIFNCNLSKQIYPQKNGHNNKIYYMKQIGKIIRF